jgi:predicted transcriptional regulator
MPLQKGSSKETISTNIGHCISVWKKTGKVSGKSVSKDKAMKMCAAMSYSSARKSATSSALVKRLRKR